VKNFLPGIKSRLSSASVKFKSLSLKKKILVIIGLFVLFIFASTAISNATKEPPYKLAKATTGNIEEIVSETGDIVSINRTDVYSPTNGVVTEVNVANGSLVTEGQVLFRVESSATEQEQKSAQANYLAAASALNTARSNANSLKSDMLAKWQTYQNTATSDSYENSDGTPRHDQRANSEFHIVQNNWIAAEAKYKDQQTAISAAAADVQATRILYDATQDAVVKAPADGVVANLSVSDGSGVTIHTATSMNPPVLTITSAAAVEAKIEMSENDIVKLEEGQDVRVDISAIDDKKYKGIVRRVDSIGTEKGGVTKYNAYIEILDNDDRIKPGMNVDAEVSTKKLSNVLTVPNSAVKPYNGGKAVRVVDPKTKQIKFVPVRVGVRGKSKTQILSGINEGQEVVVSLSNESLKRPGLF
jgi:RND family efflux transporter MFP subunit